MTPAAPVIVFPALLGKRVYLSLMPLPGSVEVRVELVDLEAVDSVGVYGKLAARGEYGRTLGEDRIEFWPWHRIEQAMSAPDPDGEAQQ